MDARVLFASFHPQAYDEINQLLREAVIPAARRQKGFSGLLLLAQPNKGILMSLWDTEHNRMESERRGYVREELAKFAHLVTAHPIFETYETSVHDMVPGTTSSYARFTSYYTQPGKVEEQTQIFRDSVVPAARKMPGYNGLFLLTDDLQNRCRSISVWETEDNLNTNEHSAYYEEQMDKVAHLLIRPSVGEVYKVETFID